MKCIIDDQQTPGEAMSNLEMVKEIVKGMKAGTDQNFKKFISEELVIDSPVMDLIPQQESPSKTLIEVFGYWKNAFPEVTSKWSSIEEKEDGSVIVNWEASARHTGEVFFGVPAKDVAFAYNGRTTYTFQEQKLVHYRARG